MVTQQEKRALLALLQATSMPADPINKLHVCR